MPSGLEITEIEPDKKTAITKQNLQHLEQVYELQPFLFLKKVSISSTDSPPTTAMLNIGTRFAHKPNKLLSQLLHEQLHVWLRLNTSKTAFALAELKKIYPRIPSETRAQDRFSVYPHLIVCYLEYEALTFYLGRKQATQILTELMRKDKILPWVYFQVLKKNFAIKQIVKRYELLPPPLI